MDGIERQVSAVEFRGVRVRGGDTSTTFDPAQELLRPAIEEWPVVLESAGGRRLGVRLTLLGNPDICAPTDSGEDWTYTAC